MESLPPFILSPNNSTSMTGTVILTGANGSVGIPAAEQLLKAYPQFTAILTVRNAAESDANTQRLRGVIARYPDAKVSVHEVDFANLAAVHEFANQISAAIEAGEYPSLQSIICCAAYWNLVGDSELTVDGYDKTLQISHIAHAALVLRLIGSFTNEGRIVLFSSIGHYRKPNAMTSYLPDIPDDIDQLHHPPSSKDKLGRGFQRYGTSKLVITTWMYTLNRYLQQNPKFSNSHQPRWNRRFSRLHYQYTLLSEAQTKICSQTIYVGNQSPSRPHVPLGGRRRSRCH
ncbi:hypothetical protein F5B20DRAFT_567334 [Whalleya microplaca]|nr:hypothetical protein F5B20DRAFT_567334 [Whalleya microplaca]